MNKKTTQRKIAYMLLEGPTEKVFYERVFSKYLKGIPKKIDVLDGNLGINKKIVKKLDYFLSCNPNTIVNAYVFIDREGPKAQKPDFNAKEIIRALNTRLISQILKIEAVLMIESWFFYDLENICAYLGTEPSKSLRSNYGNPERLTADDLSDLFRKAPGKRFYKKGDAKFQSVLDIDKIYSKCRELNEGIQAILSDFNESGGVAP